MDKFANPIEVSGNPYCQYAPNTRLALLHHNANPLPFLAPMYLEGIYEELHTALEALQVVESVLCQPCNELVFKTEECRDTHEGLHDSYASFQATASELSASEERFRALICAIPNAVSVDQSTCDRIQECSVHLKNAFEQLSREVAERQQIEKERDQSVSLLNGTLEATVDGIIVSQNGSNIAAFNQNFVEMWSIPESVATSRDLNQVLPLLLEQLKNPEAFMRQEQDLLTQSDGEVYGVFELKDGRIFERYSLPQRVGGEIVGRVCSFRDITERKQAEKALKEKEAFLQLILDNIPQFIFWKDRHSVYLGCNRNFALVAGLNHPEEIVGKTDYDLAWKKEESDFFRECDARVMETATAEYHIIEPQLQANGKQAWLDTNKIPLHNTEGQVVGILGTYEDITQRRQRELEIQQSEQKYRHLFHNSLVGMFRNTLNDGTVIDANAAILKMFGFDSFEGVKAVDLYVNPADREILKQQLMERGFVENFETQTRRKDGSVFWVSYSGQFYAQQGYLEGIMIDITERKQAEEELKEAKQELEIRVEERTAQLRQAIRQLHREIEERTCAQEALRTTNQTLQTLIQASPLAIIAIDADASVMMWNPAAERLFGWSEQDVLGRSLPIIPEDKKEEFQAQLEEELKGKAQTGLEVRRQKKDGSVIDVNLWTAPLSDNQGVVIGSMGLFVDISDKLRDQQALQSSQQQLQAILDHSPAIIYLKDTQGRNLLINRQFEILFHIDQEAVKGKTEYELFPDEIADALRANDLHVLQSKTPLEIEELIPQDDGLHIYHSIKFPLYDSTGVPYALCGISTDITDHKRDQKEQQKLIDLIESSSDFIGLATLEGRCLFLNEAGQKLVGLEAIEDVRQRLLSEYFTPDDEVEFTEYILPVVMEQGRWEGEFSFRHFKTGKSIPVYFNLFTIEDRQTGQPIALATVTRDITERKNAEEELRQSEARFREVARREALLNRLASQIRNSLDLDTILETAVIELYNQLEIDVCLFAWYRPGSNLCGWEIVKEVKNADSPNAISLYPLESWCPFICQLVNQEVLRMDYCTDGNCAMQQILLHCETPALLSLPIQTQSGELGAIACGRFISKRTWTDDELELLQAVVNQLVIGINQAQLYEQSRVAATAAQIKASELEVAMRELQHTQAQLIQTEKMSSLGQLVAGVAHEINNPLNFIHGNLTHVNQYTDDLLNLIQIYQKYYIHPVPEFQSEIEAIDLNFITEDLPKLMSSMQIGAERIRQIVLSLRNFSRLEQAEMKPVDVHEGLDTTLLILAHRLKAKPHHPAIEIIKEYGNLPKVWGYAGQLNQVFMNILSNAIDALEELTTKRLKVVQEVFPATERLEENLNSDNAFREQSTNLQPAPPTIEIRTEVIDSNQVLIRIVDNGAGISEEVRHRLFDPFFTTKPVGQGTGLGLSISYQIVVEKHHGQLQCISTPGQGTEFLIYLPIQQPMTNNS